MLKNKTHTGFTESKLMKLFILHWIINPGPAFNELALGQRVPKELLRSKDKDKTFAESFFVPCPHCDQLNDLRIWSIESGRAFGNWFGLYCPNCGGIIPCVRNITAVILILLTFPLWYWSKNFFLKKWLAAQPARYDLIDTNFPEIRNIPVVAEGIGYALLFYVISELFINFILNGEIIFSVDLYVIGVYLFIGFLLAFLMRLLTSKKNINI